MKCFAFLVAAAILAAANPPLAHADEASKSAKIEEMLALTHADQMTQQIFAQMQPMLASQLKALNLPDEARSAAEEMQKKILAMVAERLSWDKMKPMYVKIYAETFSEEELKGIVDFYKSPAGQAMLDKMPQLMQKSMAISQQMLSDLLPEFAKMGEDLRNKYKK